MVRKMKASQKTKHNVGFAAVIIALTVNANVKNKQ